MKMRAVVIDFGQEIFGESPRQQAGDGNELPSEAKNERQIADSDERTGAMLGKMKNGPTEE